MGLNDQGILEAPLNISSVSKATLNGALDISSQCCDCNIFYEYTDGTNFLYTRAFPDSIIEETKISIYEFSEGSEIRDSMPNQDAMLYKASITVSSGDSFIYKDVTYTYNNNYKYVRIYATNKWARYKPIIRGSQLDIDNDVRKSASYGIAAIAMDNPPSGIVNDQDREEVILSIFEDVDKGAWKWPYAPPIINVDWSRINDFIGYYKKAENPFEFQLTTPFVHSYMEKGVLIVYINTNDDKYSFNFTIGAKLELSEYNIHWYDIIAVFGDTTKYDFSDPEQFESIGEFYADKPYGLIYFDGREYEVIDGWDSEGKVALYPVCQYIPEDTDTGAAAYLKVQQEIPVSLYKDKECTIVGFINNGKKGNGEFLLPRPAFKLKWLKQPPILEVLYVKGKWSNTKDYEVKVALTRSQDKFWTVFEPEATVTSIWITNSMYINDYGLSYIGYKSDGSIGDRALDNTTYRKADTTENWNGVLNNGAPELDPVDTPNIMITPITKSAPTIVLTFYFPMLKDLLTDLTWEEDGNLYIRAVGDRADQNIHIKVPVFEMPE